MIDFIKQCCYGYVQPRVFRTRRNVYMFFILSYVYGYSFVLVPIDHTAIAYASVSQYHVRGAFRVELEDISHAQNACQMAKVKDFGGLADSSWIHGRVFQASLVFVMTSTKPDKIIYEIRIDILLEARLVRRVASNPLLTPIVMTMATI